MRRIVLGSSSPYRKALMETLGIAFDVAKPSLDEEKAKIILEKNQTAPLLMAQTLARLKAESLKEENALIIGSDQLIHFDGKILGKPHTKEKAIEQLSLMNNKSHEIITAVCITGLEQNIEFHDVAKLKMKNLSLQEIKDYVGLDEPLDCAGSYKIEKNGKLLFSNIEAQDFSAIEGLPLISLNRVLQSLGYDTKKI